MPRKSSRGFARLASLRTLPGANWAAFWSANRPGEQLVERPGLGRLAVPFGRPGDVQQQRGGGGVGRLEPAEVVGRDDQAAEGRLVDVVRGEGVDHPLHAPVGRQGREAGRLGLGLQAVGRLEEEAEALAIGLDPAQ